MCMSGSSLANAAVFALVYPAVRLPVVLCCVLLMSMGVVYYYGHVRESQTGQPVPASPTT